MTEDESIAPIDKDEVHGVFGLLREHIFEVAQGFQAGVTERLARVTPRRNTNPGLLRVALSALLQTTNLVVDALSGHVEDENKDDTRA